MKRDDFINFLLENSCVIVRTDKTGYSVIRNTANEEMSGVPANDPLKPTTVCLVCRNLKLESIPDEADIYLAKVTIDKVHASIEAGE